MMSIDSLTAVSPEQVRIYAWNANVPANLRLRKSERLDETSGFVVTSESKITGQSFRADQVELTHASGFEGVVHHDRECFECTKDRPVGERFHTTVLLITHVMGATLEALGGIRAMDAEGKFGFSAQAWVGSGAAEAHYEHETAVYAALYGIVPRVDSCGEMAEERDRLRGPASMAKRAVDFSQVQDSPRSTLEGEVDG